MGERIKGKVAIVTGAGSRGSGMGNGKASAILYAREGAQVMAVDFNLDAARETKRLIDKEGGDCIVFEADVSKSSDCANMVEKCIQTFGKVDILHNNVGISGVGGAVETGEEEWDRIMNVTLKSMFLTCKCALPYMENRGSGVIINISSIRVAGVIVFPSIAYGAAKAGVIALTRDIAIQYAQKGIRANTILPGMMRTPMFEFYSGQDTQGEELEDEMRKWAELCPTGKLGDAWDTAYAALFLASDDAKYITGTTLYVDGGISIFRSLRP